MNVARWPRRLISAVLGFLTAGLLLTAAPASSAAVEEPCSRGDALAVFDSFPTFVTLEGGYPPCQYRLFWDREHVTFHDGDWFVGGIAYFFTDEELQQFGMTRQEGIAELENIAGRLWLATIGPRGKVGTLIEQSLMTSGYKDGRLGDEGVVYRQDGIILNLPPGDYLSVYEESCGSEFWEQFGCREEKVYRYEVILHVLPD